MRRLRTSTYCGIAVDNNVANLVVSALQEACECDVDHVLFHSILDFLTKLSNLAKDLFLPSNTEDTHLSLQEPDRASDIPLHQNCAVEIALAGSGTQDFSTIPTYVHVKICIFRKQSEVKENATIQGGKRLLAVFQRTSKVNQRGAPIFHCITPSQPNK